MDWSPGSHGPLTHSHSLCFPAPCGDLRDSHLPLLSPFTPGRPWLSRGTKHRKAAFSSADDQPCRRYYSRPPCQFPFFRPRDTGTTSSLLPGSPTQLWGLEQGGAWGAHTVWRSCWFPALYLPMRGSRPLKEGQAASMAPHGRMVGPRVQGFQAPIPAVSSNYSLTLPSQRQLNWKFPLSPGPPVLYEGSAKRHSIRGAG